jgi:hypothetical protein
VATRANAVLDSDNNRVSFAFEKALKSAKKICINFAGKRSPFFYQFLLAALERFGFCFKIVQLSPN